MFYVLVAIGFGVWFTVQYGVEFGTEYFAGYLIEKSLSVDDLFVFVIIMTTFAVVVHPQPDHVRGRGLVVSDHLPRAGG